MRKMGKLRAVAAITAIGNVYANDLQSTAAHRIESKLSNDLETAAGQGLRLDGRDLNSVLEFYAHNPSPRNEQITGTAPPRPPIGDSDQDHQGVPVKKSAMIPSDANSHFLASHGFHSPYYPNTSTHTCLNDGMYPHSYLYNVGYYFSHSAVECCRDHFSQSYEHCAKAGHYEDIKQLTSPVVIEETPGGYKKPIVLPPPPPPPPKPIPVGTTTWWSGGAKSSKCMTKSGKSKSSKSCQGYLPIKQQWPVHYPPIGKVPVTKKPTMPPSPISSPTFSPTKKGLTMMPQTLPPKPSTPQPSGTTPTYAPTFSWPTWNPTSATYAPTGTGVMPTTPRPTLAPSAADGFDLCVWGSSLSTSQPGDELLLTPVASDIQDMVDASAGSKYSVVVGADGTASSTGVIESMEAYRGHLGIQPMDLVEGQNLFQPISLVFDEEESGVTSPPKFKKAFAGVEVGVGNTHTMLIDSMGRAWATGSNDKGQLCLGDQIDRLIPERIYLPRKVVDIAVGGEFTLLLTDDGVVYGCGSNALGQLGLGSKIQDVAEPTMIGLSSPAMTISAGKDHSLIKAADGYYVMGSNEFGQLCTDTGGDPLLVPRALALDAVVTQFKATKSSSFLLYVDGSVNGCGKNSEGQLGDGSFEDTFIAEVVISGVASLGTGPSAESAFFIDKVGNMWGTGLNDKGQLGVGDTVNRNVPTLIIAKDISDDLLPVLLSAAEDHTLSLEGDVPVTPTMPPVTPTTPFPTPAPAETTTRPTMKGDGFFFWGDPKSLGEDSEGTNIEQPIILAEEGVLDAAAGSQYSMIVLNDGSVLSGGFISSIEDYKGHLGLNPAIVVQGVNILTPVERVIDGGLIPAPFFQRVFAGVENTANTGNIHSILLDRNGRAYASGSNNAGQLCLGDEVDRKVPERIPVDNRIIDVAIGGEHTLLLDEFGNVYGCGSNQLGQLGLGTTDGTSLPTKVPGVDKVVHVSSGKDHSLFHAEDAIYVTGNNSYGQLCIITDTAELNVPTKLNLGDGIAENIKQLDAISSSSFILYADGTVNACGRNNFGQLGDGSNEDAPITTVALDSNIAVRILGIGPSAESAFFVTENGDVFGTGLNDKGQLGVGDQSDRNTPTRVDFDGKMLVTVLVAARDHSIALIGDGPVVSPPTPAPKPNPTPKPTGSSTTVPATRSPTKEEGNLPTSGGPGFPTYSPTSLNEGTPLPTYSPTSVDEPNQPTTQSGSELYYWGSLESIGGKGQSTSPEEGDTAVADVSAGSRYSVIILPDGTAQSAGYIESLDDYHGHLGRGSDVTQGQNSFATITNVLDEDGESISPPFFTKAFAGAEQFSSPGAMHTILLDSDGRVYATGSNSKGQLCIGDFADRSSPQRINIEGVKDIAIGNEHTLLLLEDGTVVGCGSNEFGQLGLGENIKVENIPTNIDIEGTVVGISSGLAFSLFMSSAGLFVTGNNSYGQLCVNEGDPHVFSPIPLSLGSSITVDLLTSFEAIQTSSFILFKDGGVAACGRNNFGQLGNGSNEDVLRTLVPIPDNTPIRSLGVGPSATSAFFVNVAGNVYATGLNDRGQLGTGDTTDRNALTRIDISGAEQISASNDHTLSRLSE